MSPSDCHPPTSFKKKKSAALKSFQQSVSAKSSILLPLLLLVFLCCGMALHGGIHFGLSWLRRGCFGLKSRALCASQSFSLVKLNSFLFSSKPPSPHHHHHLPTAPLLFCGLMLLASRAISSRLLFQAFSYSDNFTLLGLIFSHISMNRQEPAPRLQQKKTKTPSSLLL